MRLPLRGRSNTLDMDSAMTPMIDVVFLLLVFFVWTMSFRKVEMLLSSNLSQEKGNKPIPMEQLDPNVVDFEQIVIQVFDDSKGSRYKVNETELDSIKAVEEFLNPIRELQPNAPIVVQPEPVASMGPVVNLVDLTRRLGFQKVSFAITPEKNSGL